MTFSIHLNKEQSERLLRIYSMVQDPEITCVEDYIVSMLDDLLSRIWDDVKSEIMN